MLKKLLYLSTIFALFPLAYCMEQESTQSKRPHKPLFDAIRQKDNKMVKLILDSKIDINNIQDKNGDNPLTRAIVEGDEKIIKLLIDKGAYINTLTGADETPLMVAASDGREKIAKILLAHGASINMHNERGQTALMYAAESGQVKMIELLLSYGAESNAQSKHGQTSLMMAAYNGHFEAVVRLVQHGADYNIKDHKWDTALTMASGKKHEKIARFLLDNGADVNILLKADPEECDSYSESDNSTNQSTFSPLMQETALGHEKIVKLLLDKGAIVDLKNSTGLTALMYAAQYGHPNIAKILIEHEANVNSKDNERGFTPLMHAVSYSQDKAKAYEIVKLLLKCNADVNAQDNYGFTALMHAIVRSPSKNIIELLLEAGAKLAEIPEETHHLPCFEEAVVRLYTQSLLPAEVVINQLIQYHHVRLVLELLDKGFNKDLKDERGRTLLMTAASYNCIPVAKTLMDLKAQLGEHDANGDTALSLAAFKGHFIIVKLLLDAKAYSKEDITHAFLIAAQRGKVTAMQLLLEAGAEDTYGYSKLLYPQGLDHDHCHTCKKSKDQTKLSMCGQCKAIRYCSRECMANDWKNHASFCKAKHALDLQAAS